MVTKVNLIMDKVRIVIMQTYNCCSITMIDINVCIIRQELKKVEKGPGRSVDLLMVKRTRQSPGGVPELSGYETLLI